MLAQRGAKFIIAEHDERLAMEAIRLLNQLADILARLTPRTFKLVQTLVQKVREGAWRSLWSSLACLAFQSSWVSILSPAIVADASGCPNATSALPL